MQASPQAQAGIIKNDTTRLHRDVPW